MVERLAAQLEAEPNDADGWQRLGRAWGVLGEREKSIAAYARAGALRPDDASIALAEAQALLEGLAPTAPFPPRALELLKRVNAAVADYERLQMLVIAREPWSIENGCLTPTMKDMVIGYVLKEVMRRRQRRILVESSIVMYFTKCLKMK
jgi:tetratricopeptide (TPR) repeat protein